MEQNPDLISFHIHEITFDLLHSPELSNWLKDIASSHDRTMGNLEYVICSDDYLLEINKTYLKHDYYTDIITFPLNENPLEATIYISLDRVVENAKNFKSTTLDELHRVIAHGLLHLLGYGDKTDEEKQEMRAKENSCLELRTFI